MKCTCRIKDSSTGYYVETCALCEAASDLYDACKRIITEFAAGEDISIGVIEDCKSAIDKAEGQS